MDYIVTSNRAMAEYWQRKAKVPPTHYRILTTVAEIDQLDLVTGTIWQADWIRHVVPVSDELIDAANRAIARSKAKAS